MQEVEDKRPGLFASLKRLLKTVAAIAENRLELLLIEWQEERVEVGVFGQFQAEFLVELIQVQPAEHLPGPIAQKAERLGLVVALGLVYLLATIGCYWRLRRRLKGWAPFAATLAEIKKDKACLEDKS